jgi:hypothetical protein
MNNFSENNEEQFANGQVNCDLGGSSDPAESETQFDAANVIEKDADALKGSSHFGMSWVPPEAIPGGPAIGSTIRVSRI